jgi:hypothetical protein
MVPSGLLPAVKIDGQLITESMDIMIQLEAQFPERPLLPAPGSQESKSLQVRISSKTARTASRCFAAVRSAHEGFSLPRLALEGMTPLKDMTPLKHQLWPGSWQTPIISRHLGCLFFYAANWTAATSFCSVPQPFSGCGWPEGFVDSRWIHHLSSCSRRLCF